MRKLFVVLLAWCCCSGAFTQKNTRNRVTEEISKAMNRQEMSWNRGDIEAFMSAYWKSDSLRFIGKSGLTYGWQHTLDNYLRAYPDRKAMGRLTFTNLVTEFTDRNTILVIGKWQLEREAPLENLAGHYSLLWKKKGKNWVIVLDHSS